MRKLFLGAAILLLVSCQSSFPLSSGVSDASSLDSSERSLPSSKSSDAASSVSSSQSDTIVSTSVQKSSDVANNTIADGVYYSFFQAHYLSPDHLTLHWPNDSFFVETEKEHPMRGVYFPEDEVYMQLAYHETVVLGIKYRFTPDFIEWAYSSVYELYYFFDAEANHFQVSTKPFYRDRGAVTATVIPLPDGNICLRTIDPIVPSRIREIFLRRKPTYPFESGTYRLVPNEDRDQEGFQAERAYQNKLLSNIDPSLWDDYEDLTGLTLDVDQGTIHTRIDGNEVCLHIDYDRPCFISDETKYAFDYGLSHGDHLRVDIRVYPFPERKDSYRDSFWSQSFFLEKISQDQPEAE